MKNLLPWLKSNWLIVVLSIVAVAALPSLWFVSSGMNKKTVEEFQKRVQAHYNDVSNAKNNYQLTSPTGDAILVNSAAINATRTRAYQEIGERLMAQTGTVSRAAIELNGGAYRPAPAIGPDGQPVPPTPEELAAAGKGRHQPLIEGLFPEPTALARQAKPKEFARELLQEARPALLKSINAGGPPDPNELAARLNELVNATRDQVRQQQGRTELDTAEQEALRKDLQTLRLSTYQRRAQEIQVYADEKIFDEVPTDAMDKDAPLAQLWDWQERLWINTDVFAAVAAANGDSGGRGVAGSVVKRIVKLSVDDPPFETAEGNPTAAGFEAGADRAPSNFARSITGRISGPGSNNKWYDVRYVTIEMVADARRLPAFIDALASVNFMTVVDADLVKVDPAVELREGFYYGDEPVVRATLVIETVWFREWRERWMPAPVKQALGMDQNVAAADPAASAAPARPRGGRPPGGPPPGEEGGGRRGGRRGGGMDEGGGG